MMAIGQYGPTGTPGIEDYEKMVRQTSQRLAQQGITLYIVDAKGLETRANDGRLWGPAAPARARQLRAADGRRTRQQRSQPAMRLMASITGGRYLYDTNDLAVGFRKTVADLRGAYTLGFYAPEEPDNKWHKLKVTRRPPRRKCAPSRGIPGRRRRPGNPSSGAMKRGRR